jgi:glutathione S-transferase
MLQEGPSGKFPVLRDGDLSIWDSLAIIEYLAEKYPERNVWPKEPRDRAQARSLCAEMHSGFMAFRQNCPTNFRREKRAEPREINEDAQSDLARIEQIFAGARGAFLFGDLFCAADAFFAPVASRIDVFALRLSAPARAYCDRILAHPAFRDWSEGARSETWEIDKWEGL